MNVKDLISLLVQCPSDLQIVDDNDKPFLEVHIIGTIRKMGADSTKQERVILSALDTATTSIGSAGQPQPFTPGQKQFLFAEYGIDGDDL